MSKYVCRICGCNCDAGELSNGVCEICLEEEKQKEVRKDMHRKMLARNITEQSDGQLVMCYAVSG